MKVTIITSCYNREATIRDAIRSVLAQDYPDIEYIIVDGASTDRTVEIVSEELRIKSEELRIKSEELRIKNGEFAAAKGVNKETASVDSKEFPAGQTLYEGNHNSQLSILNSQLLYEGNHNSQFSTLNSQLRSLKFISEPDSGMYEALNKGIRMATGDVIALLHSDDVLYDCHTISDVVREMERTECDFLYADGLFVDAEKTDRVVRNWIGGRYTKWKVRHGWLPLHPTCYIRRDVMMRLGLYDESYRIAADTDLLVRYLLENDLRVEYLKRYVVRMRMGGLSTDNSRRAKMWREDIRVYRSHGFRYLMLTKIEKMLWKVPQFVTAKLKFLILIIYLCAHKI